MPVLPLDFPDPFAATLGVMLYPGVDSKSRDRARSFASNLLGAGPLAEYFAAGGDLLKDALKQIALGGGGEVDDRSKRWNEAAFSVGVPLKVLFALAHTEEKLVSWENAMLIVERTNPGPEYATSRASLTRFRREFLTVAHLWGAYALRDWQFIQDLSVGYTYADDFQSFLAEAEALRCWGQGYTPGRAKSCPILPAEMWTTPADWASPERREGWPDTGRIRAVELAAEQVAGLRPQGRPATLKG